MYVFYVCTYAIYPHMQLVQPPHPPHTHLVTCMLRVTRNADLLFTSVCDPGCPYRHTGAAGNQKHSTSMVNTTSDPCTRSSILHTPPARSNTHRRGSTSSPGCGATSARSRRGCPTLSMLSSRAMVSVARGWVAGVRCPSTCTCRRVRSSGAHAMRM